jgi:hypothetical protein
MDRAEPSPGGVDLVLALHVGADVLVGPRGWVDSDTSEPRISSTHAYVRAVRQNWEVLSCCITELGGALLKTTYRACPHGCSMKNEMANR